MNNRSEMFVYIMLNNFVDSFGRFRAFSGAPSGERRSILPTCSLCNLVVRGIFQSFEIGLTDEDIVDNIALTCISRNLYEEEICRGVATAAIVRT